MSGPELSIFKTFKTKNHELTGEAVRQRSILVALATQANPAERTRTAISQRIAGGQGTIWKNIYSGIFRDLDEVLIPLKLVREEGRLPLKRGPRALQERGIPYYHLTPRGVLVCLALDEIAEKDAILQEFFAGSESDRTVQEEVTKFAEIAPRFTYSLFEKYVRSYCNGELGDLLPLDPAGLRRVAGESALVLREFLAGYSGLSKPDRAVAASFLDRIS